VQTLELARFSTHYTFGPESGRQKEISPNSCLRYEVEACAAVGSPLKHKNIGRSLFKAQRRHSKHFGSISRLWIRDNGDTIAKRAKPGIMRIEILDERKNIFIFRFEIRSGNPWVGRALVGWREPWVARVRTTSPLPRKPIEGS
jgi:hypothetical protein